MKTSNHMSFDDHIPRCECGGKRKIITVLSKKQSIGRCKKCGEQFIVEKQNGKNKSHNKK